jgi:hypothetical protein
MDMGETRLANAPAGADEVALGPDDEGLGNVRPDEVVALDLDDEGLGNIRPDIIHVETAR